MVYILIVLITDYCTALMEIS